MASAAVRPSGHSTKTSFACFESGDDGGIVESGFNADDYEVNIWVHWQYLESSHVSTT